MKKYNKQEQQAIDAIRFTLGLTTDEMDAFIKSYKTLILGLKILALVILTPIVACIFHWIIGGLMK